MTDRPPFRHPVIHEGHAKLRRGCGKPGFYLVERPVEGLQFKPEHIRMPDGTPADPDNGVKCGACGYDMQFDLLRMFAVEIPAMMKAEREARERGN